MMPERRFPLTRIVRLEEVPREGLEVSLTADTGALASLAELIGVTRLTQFSSAMTVAPWRGGGLVVRGHLDAQAEQTCVVTLEPFSNRIAADFEDFFAPEHVALGEEEEGPAIEEIEPLVGNRIDAGAVAVEHLILSVDPHPKRPGIRFEGHDEDLPREEESPFAQLEPLRRKLQGGGDG